MTELLCGECHKILALLNKDEEVVYVDYTHECVKRAA